MSSRIENLRNYSNQLREALRVHKDQLRDVKEDLNQERIKRQRLEEELKEKNAELEQVRSERIPAIVDKNTKIKIVLSNQNPLDEDNKRKMIENIKNNLRKLLITILIVIVLFLYLCQISLNILKY